MDLTDDGDDIEVVINAEQAGEDPEVGDRPDEEGVHSITSEPHVAASPLGIRFVEPLASVLGPWPAVDLATALRGMELKGRSQERRRGERRLGERRGFHPPPRDS